MFCITSWFHIQFIFSHKLWNISFTSLFLFIERIPQMLDMPRKRPRNIVCIQCSFSSFHTSKDHECNFDVIAATFINFWCEVLGEMFLLLGDVLFPIFVDFIFDCENLFIKVFFRVGGLCIQVADLLILILDLHEVHYWTIVFFSEEDVYDLLLIHLRICQTFDLLRLFFNHFFKMIPQHGFQNLFILVFLRRRKIRHLNCKISCFKAVIKISEFFKGFPRNLFDENHCHHKSANNSQIC